MSGNTFWSSILIDTRALTFVIALGFVMAVGELAAQSTLERSKRDEIVRMSDDDPAMAKAFAKAKASLDQFLVTAKSPPPNTRSFAVKIAVSDPRDTEYFWILPFVEDGDHFKGKINNTPRLVSHVKLGQEIRVKKSEIIDWMYVDAAKRPSHARKFHGLRVNDESQA